MSLILLLPILVSGFIYCNQRYTQFIKLHRYEGQYLYLKSVKYGLFIVSFAAFLLAIFSEISPNCSETLHTFINRHVNQVIGTQESTIINDASYYIKLTVVSIALAYITAYFLNIINLIVKTGLPFPKSDTLVEHGLSSRFFEWWHTPSNHWATTKILLSCDILSDSPLDKILIDAYTNIEEILISTDSGKVYVGFISQLAEPNENRGMNQEIAIVPTMSGFRNKEDQTVQFTTYYPEDDDDSYVVLKQDLIISASPFSNETYIKVNKEH